MLRAATKLHVKSHMKIYRSFYNSRGPNILAQSQTARRGGECGDKNHMLAKV